MPHEDRSRVDRLRSIRAHGPVVLVSEQLSPVADRMQELLDGYGWACVREADRDRVRWVASVQKPAATVIVAGDPEWTSGVLVTARAVTTAGVILIGKVPSARVISALDGGTDTVISDELCDAEILARILAVIRRTSVVQEPGVRYLVAGALRIDLWARTATIDGDPMHLSPTEYKLLVFLMRHAGRVVSPTRLIDGVWGWTEGDGLNTLRIFVGRLRRKLGDDVRGPRFVTSVRGHGYSFVATVVEHGDESTGVVDEQAYLLDSISRIAGTTAQLADEFKAAEFIVRTLVVEGTTDAAAILRVADRRLEVVADDGLSPSWHRAVCPSIPLDPSYASVQSIETAEVAQFTHLSQSRRRFAQTAALLGSEGSEIGVFIPIMVAGRCWGNLGALRRTGQPFSLTTMAYLRAALAVYGTGLAAMTS